MNTSQEFAQFLRDSKAGLFSERETWDEVLQYPAMANEDGTINIRAMTLLYIGVNTYLELLAKHLDKQTPVYHSPKTVHCEDWDSDEPQPLYDAETGQSLGTLMPVDDELVANSPGIAPHSKRSKS